MNQIDLEENDISGENNETNQESIEEQRSFSPTLAYLGLLWFLRVSLTIIPAYVGAIIIVEFLWDVSPQVLILFEKFILDLPVWADLFFVWIPRIIMILLYLVVIFDIAGSIQVLAEWERRNVYRFGKFVKFVGPGMVWKIPLLQGWGLILDLRTHVERRTANRGFTGDSVPGDWEFTTRWNINPNAPWRAELELDNPRNFVLLACDATVRETVGNFTFSEIQSERLNVNKMLLEGVREKIKREALTKLKKRGIEIESIQEQEDIVIIEMLALTDTIVPPAVEDALSRQAVEIALSKGRQEAARYEVEAAENLTKAAQVYVKAGLRKSEGEIALQLRQWAFFREVAGEKGTGWFAIPQLQDVLGNSLKIEDVEKIIDRMGKKE